MAVTDISLVGSKVVISEAGKEPEHLSNISAKYHFYQSFAVDTLSLKIYLDGEVIPYYIKLSDLRIGGAVSAPSSKADALTALDAVFPNANSGSGGGSGSVVAEADIVGDGTSGTPLKTVASASALVPIEDNWDEDGVLTIPDMKGFISLQASADRTINGVTGVSGSYDVMFVNTSAFNITFKSNEDIVFPYGQGDFVLPPDGKSYIKIRTYGGAFIVTDAKNYSTAAAALPYKTYSALLSQSGTDAPIAAVLQNTLSSTPVWSRNSVGNYSLTLAGEFTWLKTQVFLGEKNKFLLVAAGGEFDTNSIIVSTGYIDFETGDVIQNADGLLDAIPIEIRIYP